MGTRVEGELRRSFFKEYVNARVLDKDDREAGNALAAFEGEALLRLQGRIDPEILRTPVRFSDRLSNRVLAVFLVTRSDERVIVINARLKIDPEILAHTLLEEIIHAQQAQDGLEFEEQKQRFPDYDDRPYEKEAKAGATEILGYSPADYDTMLVRDEPGGPLYDR